MTDWNEETEQLGSGNFWKPETGNHKVRFLDDGRPSHYRDPQGRVTDQINFKIKVNGEEKIWTVTKARTVNSLYGQIVLMGKFHGNLEGKEITLLVKFDHFNNKREYTVQEALPLIAEWSKQKKGETHSGQGSNKNNVSGIATADSMIDKTFRNYVPD